jgi:protein-tyrosine phosphatase
MRKEVYWIDGPWTGKLAVGPRPRGGEWLADDVASWRRQQIDSVLSLLTPEEEENFDLRGEAKEIHAHGMNFISYSIPDRQVPRSETQWSEILGRLSGDLSAGRNLLVHCRQGIGRSGLVAACLLVKKGMTHGAAVDSVSAARGLPIPETDEQREWIEHFAAASTGTN